MTLDIDIIIMIIFRISRSLELNKHIPRPEILVRPMIFKVTIHLQAWLKTRSA